MTQTQPAATSVEVMWRPGCPFCSSLRRGLRRAGVATDEQNIWSSSDAATRVRRATGGDETVPTVFVGEQALVNPSVEQVVEAIQAVDATYQLAPSRTASRPGGASMPKVSSPGLVWTLVVAVVWIGLVAWRPDTTWHVAPLILAATWAWVIGQDSSPGDHSARRSVIRGGVAGLGVALALTGILAAAGGLAGPTWTGSGSPAVEALLLSAGGAALATAVGLLRIRRRPTSASASLGSSPILTSDDIVTVEGNAYFPLTSIPDGVLQPSRTTTVCPWKGVASYYDVHIDGQVVPDGAFTYRHPSPLARRIKGRVVFWQGIDVQATRPHTTEETR